MELSSLTQRLLEEYTATDGLDAPDVRRRGPEAVLPQDVPEQPTNAREHVAAAVHAAGVVRFGPREKRFAEHTRTGGGGQLAGILVDLGEDDAVGDREG